MCVCVCVCVCVRARCHIGPWTTCLHLYQRANVGAVRQLRGRRWIRGPEAPPSCRYSESGHPRAATRPC